MLEKWQEALRAWDEWKDSIAEAQAQIEINHGKLSELLMKAKIEVNEEIKGSSKQGFSFSVNDEMWVVWDIADELKKAADDFVSMEIGLHAASMLHSMFANYWVEVACPEIRQEVNVELDVETANPLRQVSVESKRVKYGNEYIVRNSISWHAGHVEPQEVIRFLQRIKWPFDESEVTREGKGGRPPISRELKLYPQAVVCFILNRRQKLTQSEIANLFDWCTHPDSYDKPMSTTVRNRVKLGKKILACHGLL